MQRPIDELEHGGGGGVDGLEVALDRVFGDGVRPLRMPEAVFDAMLSGWEHRQRSRMLREATIRSGIALVRRVRVAAERWPWEWKVEDLEEFFSDLASAPDARRPATLRNYQSQLRGFLAFVVDARYSWRLICSGCFGCAAVQLLDEHNLIVHVSEFESDPRRRCSPTTRSTRGTRSPAAWSLSTPSPSPGSSASPPPTSSSPSTLPRSRSATTPSRSRTRCDRPPLSSSQTR